jgi:hypothetical protein
MRQKFLILLLAAFGSLQTARASGADSQLQVVEQQKLTQIGKNPPSLTSTITVRAILPDGSHARLFCSIVDDTKCQGLQSFAPEKMPVDSETCDTSVMGTFSVIDCKTSNLGAFKFKRSGNDILIYSGSGKAKLRVVGSW